MNDAEKSAHRAHRGDIRGSAMWRGTATLAAAGVEGYPRGSSTRGRSEADGSSAAAFELNGLEWLDDGEHPLDWNGPTDRIFTRFQDEDLDRPIIGHFERVARRYR